MKKLFKIDYFTIFNIVLSIITGYFKNILIFLLLSFFHELGHLIAAKTFKIEIKELKILLFGCNLKLDNIESKPSFKQVIIYMAGPCMFFVNLLVIKILFKFNMLNYVTYHFALKANLIIFIFNLLPIFPLDGYRILNATLAYFLPYKKALKYSVYISLVFFVVFLIYNIFDLQIILLLFLLFEQLKNIKAIKEVYKRFLIAKTYKKKYKKFIIISNNNLYKDKNNYRFVNGKFIGDDEIAKNALKSKEYWK